MMTPCGMYMNPRRTGGLTDFPWPESAQPMVSKRGRARAAPIPFRQVRRSIKFCFMGRGGDLFLDPTMNEGIAGDNFGNESLHAVAVFGDGLHEAIHDDFVIAFKLAA